MIIRPLPHPGYSWSLSQHAAGFDEATIRGMLVCAFPFQGQKGAGAQITELMVKAELLTPNQRGGKDDAWRDYQQILSELGLIISTKLSNELRLTQISKAFISGELPFEQLMTMQVLRYQYPNGQKHDRSGALKSALEANEMTVPESLIELHSTSGVLIKPGLLILQVLLGLSDLGESVYLTAEECRAILIPCRTNGDWEMAATEIKAARKGNVDLSSWHNETRLRRNVQDWFKLLNVTGLFETDGSSFVKLSDYASSIAPALKKLSSDQIRPESYWFPNGHDRAGRLEWFVHFGGYDSSFENVVSPISGTYSEPQDAAEVEEEERPVSTGPIKLARFDKEKLFRNNAPNFSQSMDELAAKVKAGAIKRHAKTVLHDELVLRFAERFETQGAVVKVDPNSVDLHVEWSSQETAIFEVKTVSQRSLPQRMRSAVGQVKEYAYRLGQLSGKEPEQAIIIDRPIDPQSWQRSFLNEYMEIGLICSSDKNEMVYAPLTSATSRHWQG